MNMLHKITLNLTIKPVVQCCWKMMCPKRKEIVETFVMKFLKGGFSRRITYTNELSNNIVLVKNLIKW